MRIHLPYKHSHNLKIILRRFNFKINYLEKQNKKNFLRNIIINLLEKLILLK